MGVFHALVRVWNEMHPWDTRQTGQGRKLIYTAGKYVHNAKQCICGGIVHDRCISEYTGALCEFNPLQALMNRFKKWQKSHDQATIQRRAVAGLCV